MIKLTFCLVALAAIAFYFWKLRKKDQMAENVEDAREELGDEQTRTTVIGLKEKTLSRRKENDKRDRKIN